MSSPQFADYGVEGTALETFGLEGNGNMDPLSLLIFGLVWPLSAIWNNCASISSTTWQTCAAISSTSWSDAPAVSSTTWTERTP